MKLQVHALSLALMLGLLGLGGLVAGCKDDSPCDPGQEERNSQCYPVATGGAGGAGSTGGTAAGGTDAAGAADAAAGAAAVETAFGTECADTAGSSDCGGEAPLCADLTPLGQTVMCTQINCAEGEANAGVCPSGFTCFAVPGHPSVCIKE